MTLTDPAPLTLSAPANLRDLGGIAIPGGTVRPGFAVRADDLSLADGESVDSLVAGGLTTIIDLRTAAEQTVTGRGLLGREPVAYHHVPFLTSLTLSAPTPAEMVDQTRFGAMYIRMVEQAAPQIVTALAIIAHAPGTVAFHCAAGQDRTGVLAASLLLTLGADTEDIVADYALTGASSAAIHTRLQPVMGPLMASLGVHLDEAARAALSATFSPEPMRELLTHLSTTYPEPPAPLRAAGLTDGLVARLRQRALG